MLVPAFVRRIAAGTIVLAVVAGSTLLIQGGAHAEPLPQGGEGTLTAAPATGLDVTPPTFLTSAGCPTASNAFNIRLTGPNNLDYLVTGRTQAGFSATDPFPANFVNSFKDAAALNTPPTTIVAGTYTATLNCVSGIVGQTVQGTFVVDFIFDTPTSYTAQNPTPSPTATPTVTPTSTPTVTPTPTIEPTPTVDPTPTATPTATPSPTVEPSPTAEPTPTATPSPTVEPSPTAEPTPTTTPSPKPARPTTTRLLVFPNPAYEGLPVVLIAAVSPGGAGKVQFSDGEFGLGSPKRVYLGGFALDITTLTKGRHTLTAAFVPRNPARFVPSTSAPVRVRVRGSFHHFR